MGFICDFSRFHKSFKGGRTRYNDDGDNAEDPLFSWLSEELLGQRETYTTFMKLMDNYSSETGKQENITEEEVAEQWAFIDAICDTDVIKYTHQWYINSINSCTYSSLPLYITF